jgi:hypothetical protein
MFYVKDTLFIYGITKVTHGKIVIKSEFSVFLKKLQCRLFKILFDDHVSDAVQHYLYLVRVRRACLVNVYLQKSEKKYILKFHKF